jgi:hypothetical protein
MEYNLAPAMAGKRVRCRACQANISVPGAEPVRAEADEPQEQAAAVQVRSKPARRPVEEVPEVELADDGDEDAPPPPKKSRAGLFLLIGGGVAAFLLLGCVGVGVAGWLLLRAAPRTSLVAVNTWPKTPTPPAPMQPPSTRPNTPPPTKPNTPPPPEPDDPPGPHLDADPLREPLQAPTNPSGALPLTTGRNNPVRYPWGISPVVAVQDPKNREQVWDIWNLQSMKQLGSVKGASGADLKISADGAYVAMDTIVPGSIRSGGLEVHTVADGKPLRKLPFKAGNDSRTGLNEFAGTDQFLSLRNQGTAGEATVYDLKTGQEVKTFKTVGQIDRKANVLSPGGRYLAMFDSFDFKHPIQVYELATGNVVRTLKPKMPQVSWFNCRGLVISPDGKELAALLTTDADDYLQAWDFETGKRTVSHKFNPQLAKTAKSTGPWQVDAYPTPLECVPDRSGWLAYGQLLIDHDRGNVFWTRPPEQTNVLWQRRFLDADHYATVIVKGPTERQLEIVTLPKAEIEAARKK